MLDHLHSIESETNLKFHGIINNTHLLRDTTADGIVKGYNLCKQVSDKLRIPILWNTFREDLPDYLNQLIAYKALVDKAQHTSF